MADVVTSPEPFPETAPPDDGRIRRLVIAALVALVVIIGLKVLITYWWRRGGPRRAVTSLAEEGAVKLADAVLDEVFGPAA